MEALKTDILSVLLGLLRTLIREEVTGALSKLTLADEYLTYEEAAAVVKCSPDTIENWCRDGSLKKRVHGRLVRVLRRDLDALMAGENDDAEVEAKIRQLSASTGRE